MTAGANPGNDVSAGASMIAGVTAFIEETAGRPGDAQHGDSDGHARAAHALAATVREAEAEVAGGREKARVLELEATVANERRAAAARELEKSEVRLCHLQ